MVCYESKFDERRIAADGVLSPGSRIVKDGVMMYLISHGWWVFILNNTSLFETRSLSLEVESNKPEGRARSEKQRTSGRRTGAGDAIGWWRARPQ